MQLADGARRALDKVSTAVRRFNPAMAATFVATLRGLPARLRHFPAVRVPSLAAAWWRRPSGATQDAATAPAETAPRSLRTRALQCAADCGREIGGTLARFVVYCAVLGGGAWGVWTLVNGLVVPVSDEDAARADWRPIERPAPAFALDMRGFLDGEPDYVIERHRRGGGRRDRLIWDGKGDPAQRSLVIEIYRPGYESTAPALHDPASVDGRRPLLARGGDPAASRLGSAFGPVTLVGNPLRGRDGRACLGFVTGFDDPRLWLSGLACGQPDEEAARILLACSLDRLRLVTAGGDARLAGLFARALLARSSCQPGQPPKAAGPPPALWLEGTAAPSLRREAAADASGRR